MTTKNPKLQGYILPNLHQRFSAWKKERNLEKDSQALNILLSEFFSEAIPAVEPVDFQRLQILENTVNSLSQQLEALTQTVAAIQSTPRLPSDSSQAASFSNASKKAVSRSKSSVIQNELLLEFQNDQEISTSKAPDKSLSASLLDLSSKQAEVTNQTSETAIAPAPTSQLANIEEKLPISDAINSGSSNLDTAAEPSGANVKSDLLNELLNESPETDIQVNQVANLSESPNKLLNDKPVNEIQDEVDNFGESLTTAQLASLLGVGDRAVSSAAEKGHEYFKEWSAKKGKGTWDFRVLNSSSKRVKREFFKPS